MVASVDGPLFLINELSCTIFIQKKSVNHNHKSCLIFFDLEVQASYIFTNLIIVLL